MIKHFLGAAISLFGMALFVGLIYFFTIILAPIEWMPTGLKAATLFILPALIGIFVFNVGQSVQRSGWKDMGIKETPEEKQARKDDQIKQFDPILLFILAGILVFIFGHR